MQGTESGKDKMQRICEVLRKETLEPAMQEAEGVVHRALEEAEKILQDAKQSADAFLAEAKAKLEHEKAIYQAALSQASKQAVQSLKQQVEEKLFNRGLTEMLSKPLQNPKVLADLITAVIKAIEKDGKDADLSVFIPASIPAKDVNALLAKEILEKLKEKSVLLAPIGGGVEIKLRKENITLDLSDSSLNELLASYIRKDFRETFFSAV